MIGSYLGDESAATIVIPTIGDSDRALIRALREGDVRFPQFIAVMGLALICAHAPAHAEKRVALVIGNARTAMPTGSKIRSMTRAGCLTR
jgi:hypothetical protein